MSFSSMFIAIISVSIFFVNGAPNCGYVNLNYGIGYPLNLCNEMYNFGLLYRSYDVICNTANGDILETYHLNHECGLHSGQYGNLTESVINGDCSSVRCNENLLKFTGFVNANCTENKDEEYLESTFLINECMLNTVTITSPPTRASMVFCNEDFFQIGFYANVECTGDFIAYTVRYNFNECDDEDGIGTYYTLNECTDPIEADILNKYPYRNATKKDYDDLYKMLKIK